MTRVAETIPLLQALLAQPAQRQRLIARYLRGEMDAELLAAFEERLLEDLALLDEVETEQALRAGLREAGADQVLTPDTPVAVRRAPRWPLPLTFAAGGLFGALLSLQLFAPPRGTPQAQSVAVAQLPVLRGSEPPASGVLALNLAGGPLVLRIPVSNEAGPFRVRVRDADAAALLELADLQPDADGLLDVLLALPTAQRRELTLELDAWSDGEWRTRRVQRVAIAAAVNAQAPR